MTVRTDAIALALTLFLLAFTALACGSSASNPPPTGGGGTVDGGATVDGGGSADSTAGGDTVGNDSDSNDTSGSASSGSDAGGGSDVSSGPNVSGALVHAPFKPAAPGGKATRWVSPSGKDSNPGTKDKPWREIHHAAQAAKPGDVVAILDGQYKSPIIVAGKVASAAKPLVFRAEGDAVFIDGSGADGSKWDKRDAIYIYDSAHVIVHGLHASKANRAGLRVSKSDHVTVQACVFNENGVWGIFTDFSDHTALLGNVCNKNAKEHGIYVSNASDNARIIGNRCSANRASGIQINADPATSKAEKEDGISSGCVIERNLLTGNGKIGGAAINLASVRKSTVRNNLLVNNRGTGIGMWDDGQGSQWGSKNNIVEHNTVVMATGAGRFAMTIWNGSTGNTVRNNVLVGAARGSISYTTDSLSGLKSDHNIFFSYSGWHLFEDEKAAKKRNVDQWKKISGGDKSSKKAKPVFINPTSFDMRLKAGSAGVDGGADAGVKTTYDGSKRPFGKAPDCGAFER